MLKITAMAQDKKKLEKLEKVSRDLDIKSLRAPTWVYTLMRTTEEYHSYRLPPPPSPLRNR